MSRETIVFTAHAARRSRLARVARLIWDVRSTYESAKLFRTDYCVRNYSVGQADIPPNIFPLR